MLKIRFGVLFLSVSMISGAVAPMASWAAGKKMMTAASPADDLPFAPGDPSFGKVPLIEGYQEAFNRNVDDYYAKRDTNRVAAQQNLDKYVSGMKDATQKLRQQEARVAAIEEERRKAAENLRDVIGRKEKLESDQLTAPKSDSDFQRERKKIDSELDAGRARVSIAVANAAQARAEYQAANKAMQEHQARLEAHVQRDFDKSFKLAGGDLKSADPDALRAELAQKIESADKMAKDQALLEMARQLGDKIQDDYLKSGDLFRDLKVLQSQYKDAARFTAVKNELNKRLDNTLMGQYVQDSILKNLCSPEFNNKVAACQADKVPKSIDTSAPRAGDARSADRTTKPAGAITASDPNNLGQGLKLESGKAQ